MPDEPTADDLAELLRRRRREEARAFARQPKHVSDVLAQVSARRGFNQTQANFELIEIWREAVGDLLARNTRIGAQRRNTLEIIVSNSTLVQEMAFLKPGILEKLQRLAPNRKIAELRFRVGEV